MNLPPVVMILDDDQNLRKTLGDILLSKGFQPVLLSLGQQAIEQVGKTEIAVALIDLRLGDMPGLEVLRGIRDNSPSTECILLTGHASQASAIEAINLGAYSYYQKPFDIEQLILAIRRAAEKREAARALVESQVRYHTFINATTDLAFLKDDQFKYVIVNQANASYFGKSVAEIIGKDDFELLDAKTAENNRHSDQQVLRENSTVTIIEGAAGRYYETHKFPVPLQNGQTGIGGYVRDITERKQADEQIQLLNTQLEQRVQERTARLQALNLELESFSHSVSHDLRAPLRVIDGFARILMEDYSAQLDSQGLHLLETICSNIDKMGAMITALLNLSRLTRAELACSWIDMTALAQAAYDELATPEVGAAFSFSVNPLPSAYGDPALLRQVWANLISNAIKYTLPQPQCAIQISAEVSTDHVIYKIHDTGIGFDSQYAQKLFGVFQRLHNASQFEGVGIGLSIVQRIVHRHGGQVWAEGQPGKGATFYFSLPKHGDVLTP